MFEKTTTVVLTVDGMSCEHCSKRVEETLKALKGVKSAVVDLTANTATVVFLSSKVSPEQMAEAICNAGYHAEISA